jgi:stage II sporulation protein M
MRSKKRVRRLMAGSMGEPVNLYAFAAVLFFVGVVFGAIVVNALSDEQKTQLFQDLHGFLVNLGNRRETVPHGQIVWYAVTMNLKTIGLIWILGLSIIGLPFIVFLIFLKGFVIGFSVGFLVDQFAWKGIWLAAAAILPQNLLVVPALMAAGVAGISFSLMLVRSRFGSRNLSVYPTFLAYSIRIAGLAVVLVGAALVEGSISSRLMEWVASRL